MLYPGAATNPMVGRVTPVSLEQRKQQLIQRMTGSFPPMGGMFRPFNAQQHIPGNVDITPPIQSIYTGAAIGGGQSGIPGAQMSSVNPNIQALSNFRGGY